MTYEFLEVPTFAPTPWIVRKSTFKVIHSRWKTREEAAEMCARLNSNTQGDPFTNSRLPDSHQMREWQKLK